MTIYTVVKHSANFLPANIWMMYSVSMKFSPNKSVRKQIVMVCFG